MSKLPLFIYFICLSFFANAQTASFTYASASGGSLCSPAVINFSQTCTGNPIGFTWFFSNGQTSNLPNPSISFTAGTFTAKLQAIFDNEVLETTQSITINPAITASLAADKNYICLPGNINFTASTTGNIATYDWAFGDGASTTNNSPTIAHTYTAFGSYMATIKATDASGCSATASYNIVVQNPPISATVNPTSGCAPLNGNFNANVNVPSGSSVTNYTWSFGDGTAPVSTIVNGVNHTYADSGSYIPSLSITTTEGCANSYTFAQINFGIPPINHIAYPKKTVYCGSETTMLVAKATYANAYTWDYGDGITETVSDTITQHKYLTLGTKNIKVTPYFNGCAGTPILFSINIVGVIASYTYTNTCTAKKTFAFTNTSLGNQSSTVWSFGDATPNAITSNVVHTYPNVGAFFTNLTIIDNVTGCRDSTAVTIYTATPNLVNPDTLLCRTANTTFTIQNNYTSPATSYSWNVVGYTAFGGSINPYTFAANTFGNFNNDFVSISLGSQYCKDTIPLNHLIAVRGPNLSFTSPTSVCATKTFTITNTSAAYLTTDTVKLWYWNYGLVTKNDTIYQPPTLTYANPGSYNVKLVAKDKNGCIDSLSKVIIVKPTPFLRVFPRTDTLCQGKKDSLIAFHSDTLSWRPAAFLSCATCDTTIAMPTSTTIFYATAINSLGCSVTDSSIFTVFTPFTATAVATPVYGCIGDTVHINALPGGKKIVWSPSIGILDSAVYNPLLTVFASGSYTATLKDSVGCFSSSTIVNVIAKSLPIVNAGVDKILPYNTIFTITPTYSSNVVSYNWVPTATLSCTICPSPSGTALNTETYTITAASDSGCLAKDDITIFIECKYANLFIPNAFSPNNDNKNDIFYPQTRGIKSIVRFSIFNRYGQLLFDAQNVKPNDKNFGWNGKYKGVVQPADGYIYTLEVICELGEIITKKDSFLLLR